MANLEDIFSASMKQPRRLLDLSKVKIFTDADFFKYMGRIPELILRPAQADPDEIQIITDVSFTSTPPSTSTSSAPKLKNDFFSSYDDPLPLSMRSTRLEDLWALDIHWKMLTSDRPPNQLDGGIFERLVDLGRFALAARKQEQVTLKAIMSSIIGAPASSYLIALGFITMRTNRGTQETRLKICKYCGLELCSGGFCKVYHYESYTRMIMDDEELEDQEKEEMAFLKAVSGAGPSAPTPPAKAAQVAAKDGKKKGKQGGNQGKRLKLQLKMSKRKRKKKGKKPRENIDPVAVPDD